MSEYESQLKQVFLNINENEAIANPEIIYTAIRNNHDVEDPKKIIETIEIYRSRISNITYYGGLIKKVSTGAVFFYDFNELKDILNSEKFLSLFQNSKAVTAVRIINDSLSGNLPNTINDYRNLPMFISPIEYRLTKSALFKRVRKSLKVNDTKLVQTYLGEYVSNALADSINLGLNELEYDIRIASIREKSRKIGLPLLRLAFRDSIERYIDNQQSL